MSETYTDFLGQEIAVGDHVVYATVDGRSPVQKLAEVVKIEAETKTRRVRYGSTETEEYTSYKLGVKEIKNGRGFIRWESTIQGKPVRTSYPMPANIVKVSPRSALGSA